MQVTTSETITTFGKVGLNVALGLLKVERLYVGDLLAVRGTYVLNFGKVSLNVALGLLKVERLYVEVLLLLAEVWVHEH